MTSLEFEEVDTTGAVLQSYVLTTLPAVGSQSPSTTRLDLLPSSLKSSKRFLPAASTQSFVATRIAPLFLPHGYPHSVTADYTPYQIYDSLQAFTSSIAGLLSSRAVLQSLGMDTERSGTSTATYATLLSIARSTISNVSTILFADHMASRVSSEVKFYRFLADIMNDAGFLLEMISPSLPEYWKIPSLCMSSALRSMCGVAGGSSKAILSAHFALDGNIGELNAKDGSQETLVNLVGMWIGGIVVSRVESLWATWCWMIVLLSLHLWFNWLAVTSVRLRGLNLTRAGLVFSTLITEQRCETVEGVGKAEKVFDTPGAIRNAQGKLVLTCRIGVGIKEFLKSVGSCTQAGSGSELVDSNVISQIFETLVKERYLVWCTPTDFKALVLLKEGASRDDQLKGLCHAVRISTRLQKGLVDGGEVPRLISDTLMINNNAWQDFRRRIEETGWDVNATVLESAPGTRLRFADSE